MGKAVSFSFSFKAKNEEGRTHLLGGSELNASSDGGGEAGTGRTLVSDVSSVDEPSGEGEVRVDGVLGNGAREEREREEENCR